MKLSLSFSPPVAMALGSGWPNRTENFGLGDPIPIRSEPRPIRPISDPITDSDRIFRIPIKVYVRSDNFPIGKIFENFQIKISILTTEFEGKIAEITSYFAKTTLLTILSLISVKFKGIFWACIGNMRAKPVRVLEELS